MTPRLKSILLLGLMFVAGVVAGAVGTRVVAGRLISRAAQNPEIVRSRIEVQLTRELKLRPDQRARVRDITMRSMQQLKELRRDVHPRVQQIIARSQQEIRSVLDDAQQSKFDRIMREHPLKPAGSNP